MRRSALSLIAGFVFLAAGVWGAESDEAWIRGTFTGRSPRPQLLPESEAWRAAAEVASQHRGTFVLVGQGRSMQPLYPAGTILVLRRAPYPELQAGQTVLYRSRDNHAVAHVLVAKVRDGWRARGLNNDRPDSEPVQEQNLVGVVVAAFSPAAAHPARKTARAGTAEAGAVYFDTQLR
jgi:signal peptidase I